MADPDVSAVLRSQEFYRLKEAVTSPGSIYELDESARAIYIGPDSDIAEVQVIYYNPDAPLQLETATVSVNGPFIGRIDSLPKTPVSSTGQPARILVSPVDYVDNAYAPPGSLAHRRFNIPAIIDVIFALRAPAEVPAVRADRTIRLPAVPYNIGNSGGGGNNGSTDILVPLYGRRLATVEFLGSAIDMTMSLVTLQPGALTPIPRILGAISIPAASGGTKFVGCGVYRASDAARNGTLYNAASPPALTGNYFESDMPPNDRAATGANAAPAPRGVADLLLINIKSNAGSSGALAYCDVFVQVSDQET